ncbi:MAG: AAA family ATPase [Zetaproteobacteria bacterium CG06_land_8_20_14_3_00_59_53]|nr:MAG: AAA family ATPase [Zetaproteobacteria bacterium CG2_30_59_37]PIO90935.1 MAG: AAA family ATPase [Zetaproteobacteria bacterium CG23_combo_of_CG06-09_8_20_14_all_59_86]PIU70261.1 MAG: AAA family ATPase [Zetaproteobacteria bacterium CG06_land_8_20_14_3_00_59_53]PIU95972.1 MAG: AAA family ATPase [Zetaproteobacteria bacterium CG03_land_8_20_14_0_80_59_51]PIY44802.1 MAG: AAA family ATPase [Zetaproteobacteria bacterium CG_4_10_14_0_8_um_filter_59_127]PJC18709.1 MAG: AAA family ATPase [Zetaprot
MLVYTASKSEFIDDVRKRHIDDKIHAALQRHIGRRTSESEVRSWRNSMMYMRDILDDGDIPSDAGVAIEYVLPQTSKRVDFILTGKDDNQRDTAIIVELKQWEKVSATNKDGIVRTFIGKGERETSHPSYQAWTYAALLTDFNETVQDEDIDLWPCAYLHNCDQDEVLNHSFYSDYTDKAPAFLRRDGVKLTSFIKKYVKYGDSDNVMYRIDNGRIRPSKNLADKLVSLLQGNQEFLMIDDQKVVYETAMELANTSTVKDKHVLIVEGGPGTGKSVVAVNLLVALTKQRLLAQYVTKNSAPRAVYASKLTGSFRKSHIDNLFKGSGSYTATEANVFDALIVDEAHRLNEKSGMFNHLGENQIKEIINAAKFSIFFIDEDQKVTFKDIGESDSIESWATRLGAKVHKLELESQFRCNGSNGYLAWVDNSLQIRDTANETLEDIHYDFRVFDSPNELRDAIFEKNRISNKARLVAGYCWDWVSKKDSSAKDILIEEHNFSMKWNLNSDGQLWIIKPESVSEVGCIHTCQGLEVDYIGVIIGSDFVIRDGSSVTDAGERAKTDKSISGYKSLLKVDPVNARKKADAIIKNTYRTLMTRGMKGCYLYCTDEETNEYFKALIGREQIESQIEMGASGLVFDDGKGNEESSASNVIPFPLLEAHKVNPFVNSVPIYDLEVAAGLFSDTQVVDEAPDIGYEDRIDSYNWVELPDFIRPSRGMFVAKVVGESMNKRIPNGSWCLFKLKPVGTRQGKVVLVQHHSIDDPDTGGRYTVKVYQSEKVNTEDGGWQHSKIMLKPDSTDPSYKPIVIQEEDAEELFVIAELILVMPL